MNMDMDSAAVFLAGTILYALGIIVIVIATVVVNNIIHKHWKSWGWNLGGMLFPDRPPPRFLTEEEAARIPPHFDNQQGQHNVNKKPND